MTRLGEVAARPHANYAVPRMTTQNIADLMLKADRDRRDALRSGNHELAAECDAELDKLQGLLP